MPRSLMSQELLPITEMMLLPPLALSFAWQLPAALLVCDEVVNRPSRSSSARTDQPKFVRSTSKIVEAGCVVIAQSKTKSGGADRAKVDTPAHARPFGGHRVNTYFAPHTYDCARPHSTL